MWNPFERSEVERYASVEKVKLVKAMAEEKDYERWRQLNEQYKVYDQMENPRGFISSDTIIKTATSLVMLGLVLKYEQLNIICTKAWSWIRPRD